ncbi:hypothetical protein [Hymenobacter negativus]|uniref:Alpha/beta hydrolase n=1 Tax=Hymenobacter negativus TaxID=2795026 RepID=A0ABS3QBV9_9BACT|nr:hypothetical protein [Hymenobacter negativus]MBO2008508.1 hypothetical protein [Hymenobacter negativus]
MSEYENTVSRKLIVLLHAYTSSPKALHAVRQVVATAYPVAEIWVPALPTNMWSTADPNAIVSHLLAGIDERWNESANSERPYGSIVLIGHSIGGLLARKVYVAACGQNDWAPLEPDLVLAGPKPWAAKVERLILLAGMNRGWSISHHLSIPTAIIFSLGTVLTILFRLLGGGRLLINQVRLGAPFITQLRLQWLAMRQAAARKGIGGALTVQLLGTKDDVVAPQDNIDLITGSDFVYLDVPASGHQNILEMSGPGAAAGRRAVFADALIISDAALKARSVELEDLRPQPPLPEVTDVIFVIHGIRDEGFWTQKIARHIKEKGRQALPRKVFATETSSYGYFPMLPFILPWVRRAKVEWLMDQYTQNKALYPNARFSYFGHSNGTYMLAKALTQYPACHFENVVFAGSVVRTDYAWEPLLRQGRVKAVLNYVATADWVVAFCPKTLEMLHWQDLGSAGHDGFKDGYAQHNGPALIQQAKYVEGRHDAALKEENWDSIADFIVSGPSAQQQQIIPKVLHRNEQVSWISFGSKLPVLLLAAIGLFYLGYCLLHGLSWTAGEVRVLAFGIYLAVIWKIVTWL